MLAEIYARQKLRELEAESNQSLRNHSVSTGTAFAPKDLLRITGAALSRLGTRLEAWASSTAQADEPVEPTLATTGYVTPVSHGNRTPA